MASHNVPESALRSPTIPKPYCSVGAGPLTSFVWKSGDSIAGWKYRFNIFRFTRRGGRVSQFFGPRDLFQLVKLTQVLAAVIADDGCLSQVDRGVLKRLAAELDDLLTNPNKQKPNMNGESHGDSAHT